LQYHIQLVLQVGSICYSKKLTLKQASTLQHDNIYDHKDGDEFLSHIVTGDKAWVSPVNVETKEQSRQWRHTHSPNKLKKCKQTLSACQKLMTTVLWDRKGELVVEFMQ
jgi:hypothetical protein